ncbi:hypothetical protein D9M72_181610 [compost metagenome]
MKRTLFWLKAVLIAGSWLSMLSAVFLVLTQSHLAVRQEPLGMWIVFGIWMGHVLAIKPLWRSLHAEHRALREAKQVHVIGQLA